MTPAVVVIAYNRPQALRRLLDCLDRAQYPPGTEVPLLITIDRGATGISQPVLDIANAFEWRFGPKRVIEQPQPLGLVQAFREAGRLSREYEAAIVLEDDMLVSEPYYAFASQALQRYEADERIAAVCLYGLWFNGYTQLPFEPADDGSSVFFARLPHLQGFAFTAAQWQRFDDFWERTGLRVQPHPDMHPAFLAFRDDEWLPVLAAYLAQAERYFCFPRASLAIGWGEPGVHFDATTDWFVTPLQLRGAGFVLPPLDEALAVYDAFFELLPDRLRLLAPQLQGPAFDLDLNATKQPHNLHREHVLTTRPVRRAIATYGLRLRPPELNVAQDIEGREIALAHRDDVHWDRWAGLGARRRLFRHAWSRYRSSRRRSLQFLLARLVNRLRGH